MKRLRWQLIIIFLTGLVVGILLLTEQPEEQTLLKPEPIQGGVYTEGLIGSFQRLNPVLAFYNPVDRDVNRLLYSGLVQFDERGLPQPDIAESWGISKDGTIYNFSLRKDIYWHDGQKLVSDDILFTIEMFRQGGTTIPEDLQDFWKDVEVITLGDNNLQFVLPEPFAPFLDYLTFGIIPRHLLGDLNYDQLINASFNLQPVGCGPYQFDELIVENNQIVGISLSVFENYYGNQPYIETVIFRYYPDAPAALQAYRDGTIQGISKVTPDILDQVLTEPQLAIYSSRMPAISMVLLNLDNPETPFFQDVEVRKALLYGTNRQYIINQYLDGQAVIADGPILPNTWAYYDGIQKFEFDQDKAIDTLKAAEYSISANEEQPVRQKEGTELRFILLYPDDEVHESIAKLIQQNWQDLNIIVDLESVPYDQLINERLGSRDYQAALVDINLARSPDPDPYPFWSQVQAIGGQNYSQWDHRIASEYLEQARVANDITERSRLYHNFQVVFNQELPALPLYYPVYSYAVDYEVQGIQMGSIFDTSDRFVNINEWYLQARLPSQNTSEPILITGEAEDYEITPETTAEVE